MSQEIITHTFDDICESIDFNHHQEFVTKEDHESKVYNIQKQTKDYAYEIERQVAKSVRLEQEIAKLNQEHADKIEELEQKLCLMEKDRNGKKFAYEILRSNYDDEKKRADELESEVERLKKSNSELRAANAGYVKEYVEIKDTSVELKIKLKKEINKLQSDLAAAKEKFEKLKLHTGDIARACQWFADKGTEQERHHFLMVEVLGNYQIFLEQLDKW